MEGQPRPQRRRHDFLRRDPLIQRDEPEGFLNAGMDEKIGGAVEAGEFFVVVAVGKVGDCGLRIERDSRLSTPDSSLPTHRRMLEIISIPAFNDNKSLCSNQTECIQEIK
jgi:hypothetical protein